MKPFTTSAALSLLSATLASVLIALPAAAAEPAGPAKPDLAKGQATASAVCMACHTADGSRGTPANPILAGQHAAYLEKQLHDFKTDKRASAVMKGFASTLSDEDMRNVAAFYASKTAKQGSARNKDVVRLGERIWRGGIMEKAVPACAGCHGPTGSGIPIQYPRLGSQHADYIEVEMGKFRAGTRQNSEMMKTIAAKLSDVEIKAVADYAAGLH